MKTSPNGSQDILKRQPDVTAVRQALEWYGEQAEAMARHTIVINPSALEAVVTVLSLDGGGRAKKALATEGKA